MDKLELKKIVSKHGKWVREEDGGERADLSNADLRGANLRDADLRHANLRHADLRGADLSNASLRGASLRGANLSDASLRGAYLSNASLRGADLSDAYLSNASLRHADLSDADLSDANLMGAYLPEIIKVENLFTKIKVAIDNGGELEMGDWHGCETTHCMAGWVTTLAGEAGKAAENFAGPSWAAALIINESCPYLDSKVPNFYASNEEAMNFINECAEKENEKSTA